MSFLLHSFVWGATPYPEQGCLELLQQNQFQKAVLCTSRLMKRPGGFKYSLSLGLVHEKAGEHYAGQKPATSCYHFDRAIHYYQHYLRRDKRLRKGQRAYILKGIARLVKRSQFAQLKLSSFPGAVDVVVQGHRRKWAVRLPHVFKTMCPGKYRLQARKRGFQDVAKVLTLKRNQSLSHQVRLRLTRLRPFRMPAWGWTLIGATGVGVAGGVLYFVAEGRRQTLEARWGQDLAWKENRDMAQGLSSGAVGLFVGAGVIAGAALAVFFLTRESPSVGAPAALGARASLAPPVVLKRDAGPLCWSSDATSWGSFRCK